MKYEIPIEYFRRRLSYRECSGDLVWRSGQYKDLNAGCIVENKSGNQYRFMSISYNGKSYNFMVHQVIWFICSGVWVEELDHIDGNGLNNKLTNLRPATRSLNNKNHRKQSNNTSGLSGVSFMPTKGKWRAYGTESGKQVILNYTEDFFEAVCSRKSWESRNGFTGRHGK